MSKIDSITTIASIEGANLTFVSAQTLQNVIPRNQVGQADVNQFGAVAPFTEEDFQQALRKVSSRKTSSPAPKSDKTSG